MSALAFVVATALVLGTQAPVDAVNDSIVSEINSAPAGAVTAAMESLAYNTASIAYEIGSEVNTKRERTARILRGNIDDIIAAAMQQLADPLFQANRTMSHAGCEPPWTMDELQQRIDVLLSNCTEELVEILAAFQAAADDIERNIRLYEKAIGHLPTTCRFLSTIPGGFSSGVSCFVEKMADISQLVGKELHRMGEALIRARQLSEGSTKEAQQCTADVVDEVETLLNKSAQSC